MGSKESMANQELDDLRLEIDDLDLKLIEILRARFAIAEEIARVKQGQNMKIDDADREQEVLGQMRTIALKKGVDPDFMEELMELVMLESKRVQKECMR